MENKRRLEVGRKPRLERKKRSAEPAAFALSHPTRLEAVIILHQGEFSAGEVAKILGEDVRYVTGHLRDLYDAGCIEFVGYKVVGSRSRPIYRSVVLPIITDDVWREMSEEERHDASEVIMQGFLAESLCSHRNCRMDDDEELSLIWDAHRVDRQGRAEIRELLLRDMG